MKEKDIRPQDLFNRYLAVVRQDIETFFAEKDDFIAIPCPACDCEDRGFAFEKLGFSYQVCRECQSLYLSPRPNEDRLCHYYENGAAVRFWSTHFYRETSEQRRRTIYEPRAKYIKHLANQHETGNKGGFLDVGAGYGLLLEEMGGQNTFTFRHGIEPSPALAAACIEKGLSITPKAVEQVQNEELPGPVKLASNFEVLEHVFSPFDFLRAIKTLLMPDGIVYLTTLTIDGFDMQVLWDNSKSIYPPHHINLLSKIGIQHLMERCGLKIINIDTPGKLDLDIVRNMANEQPDLRLTRFVRHLINQDENCRQDFQQFLCRNNLSSHIRCVAQKRSTRMK